MNPTTRRVILELLTAHDGWSLGLDLVKASDGRLQRGTIYVFLSELEDAHCVLARPVDDGRREYQITSAGRAALLRDDV